MRLGAYIFGASVSVAVLSSALAANGVNPTLSIQNGGTGATSAPAARAALGAAASGSNSDITAINGLVVPLSVPQGGTGATTTGGVRSAIGAAASGANSDITSINGLTTPLSILQGGTGGTTGGIGTPFPATNGTASTSLADRFSYKGVFLDARSDLGLACDGITNDNTAWGSAVSHINLLTGPIVVNFPGQCVINWGNWTINTSVHFQALHKGDGLLLAGGQTANGPILQFGNNGVYQFDNWTLNLNGNGPSAGVHASGLYFAPGTTLYWFRSDILSGVNTGAGSQMFDLQCYGMVSADIEFSTFSLTAASSHQNQGVNCGSESQPTNNFVFRHNHLLNTALGVFGIGPNLHVDYNLAEGWGYGAAFTVEDANGTTDAATKSGTVQGNTARNSTTAVDENNTKLEGFELGYNGLLATGNLTYKTCGPGYDFYGKISLIGNSAVDAGTCNASDYYNSGFTAANPGSANTSQGSYLEANTVYDDGGGNTSYGYSDVPNTVQVAIGPNNFAGLKGATNIVGGSTFTAPQSDNLITNPCVYFDQRKNGSAFSAGFGPDQYRTYQTTGSEFFNSIVANFGVCASALRAEVSTSGSPSASELHGFVQTIPGAFVIPLMWTSGGNQTPRDLIVSFNFESNIAPLTQSCALQNINAGTDYVMPFTYSVANAVQTFSFRVPYDNYNATAPNANFLTQSPGAPSLALNCDTGSGSTNTTSTYRQWKPGGGLAAASATPFVSEPNGSVLYYTAFRVLPAEADNGWRQRSYAEELARARLFYQSSIPMGVTEAQGFGSNISVSTLTSSGTTATATIANTSLLRNGQSVTIAGATPSAYNVTAAVTITSPTTFTYPFAGGTSPATGTITASGAVGGAACAGNQIANGQPSLRIPFSQTMLNPYLTATLLNPNAANANWWDVNTSASVGASIPAAGLSQNELVIQSTSAVTAVNDMLCIGYAIEGGI